MAREQLDEIVLDVQQHLNEAKTGLRFCAFNGGEDVWVDVGDKLIGVQTLQRYLAATPSNTLHIGDQFLSTGNDFATRSACCTAWVTGPQETTYMLKILLNNLETFFPDRFVNDNTTNKPPNQQQ